MSLRQPGILTGLLSIWRILSVALIGGSLFGFCIAMTPIYDTMSTKILDCPRYTNSGTDCPVSTGYCVVSEEDGKCIFPHRALCSTSLSTGKPLTFTQCAAVDAGLGGLVSTSASSSSDATVPYRYYSSCQWVANKCTATNEIPSSRLGMIGSILTIGAFAGASVGSQLIHKLGYKRVVLLAAVVGLIAALVTHMTPFGYVAVVGMRLVLGAVSGIICVAAPTYVDIQTPQNLKDVAGCMFQISITLGIAITAVFGYILSITDGVLTIFSLQVFLALSTILCIALAAVSVFLMQPTPSSSASPADANTERSPLDTSGVGGGVVVGDTVVAGITTSSVPIPDQYTQQQHVSRNSSLSGSPTGGGGGGGLHDVELRQVRPPTAKSSPSLLPNAPHHDHHLDHLQHISKLSALGGSSPNMNTTAIGAANTPAGSPQTFFSFGNPAIKQAFITVTVLLLVMQFTGINAIMNYAPRIAKSMGVPPMLGNAVIMTWNFLTTLIAVPLASRIPLSKLYLLGLLVASIGCAISASGSYLAGSAGGVSTPLISFISCVGIAVFIAGFETGMAPAGFVLVARVYPSHLTGEAMGYYNAGQFMCGFVIIGFYPVLSDFISSAFYAAASGSSGSSTVTTTTLSPTSSSAAATVSDTALEAATAYASSVLFGVFAVVGVVGCYVLRKYLP